MYAPVDIARDSRRLRSIATGDHRAFHSERQRSSSAIVTATGHVVIVFLTVFFGWLALAERSSSMPSWVNEPGGVCMRAHRQGDFATVALAVGTPPRILNVLVNFGAVANDHTVFSLFADELLRSSTLSCSKNRVCTDMVLLVNDSLGSQAGFEVEFTYSTFFDPAFEVARSAGAEGELRLAPDSRYALTSTHLCILPNVSSRAIDLDSIDSIDDYSNTIHAVANDSKLTASVSSIPSSFPASSCANNTGNSVELFPLAASNEQSWLALTSSFLYESNTFKLEERREVVEHSTSCATDGNELEIYKLDCEIDANSICRTEPSVPFRRISGTKLAMTVDKNGTAVSIGFEDSAALLRIEGGGDVFDSVLLACMRFAILLIVAFVVFARAERATASAYHAFKTALLIASGKEKPPFLLNSYVISDGVVGVLAIVARLVVLIFQAVVLIGDGSADVVVFEGIGIACSVSHFLLRNFVLKSSSQKEAPIQKLGGSMALADASMAALLSVATTPLLAANDRNFDAVSRLLTGALIAIFVIHRIWFSFDACVLLAQTTASDKSFDENYSTVLWTSALLWGIQISSVVFSFSRLAIVPQGYSLARTAIGSPSIAESAVFVASLTFTIPLVNSVLVRI